jgi:hypothetical protein
MSVRPSFHLSAWNTSASTRRFLIKFDIQNFSKNLPIKLKFHYSLTRLTGTLHKDVSTFMIIACWILLRMRNVSDKSCRGNQNTYLTFNNPIFFFENRAVYEIMWKNIMEPEKPQMTVWPMRFVCWITRATHTLSLFLWLTHTSDCTLFFDIIS